MIYLSLLTLNPRRRQAQAELRDPYQMHRTFSKAFAEGEEAQRAARCLFRVEASDQALHVLVQSRVRPAWDRLTVGPDYWAETPRVKEFTPRLAPGQVLAFRLRANPTKRLAQKRDGRRQGDRVGLYTEEERLAWLARKASESGFALLSATVRAEDAPACQTAHHRAVFSAARFDGVVRVTDPAAALAALGGGVGAGKGFGFGLLSLAPLK